MPASTLKDLSPAELVQRARTSNAGVAYALRLATMHDPSKFLAVMDAGLALTLRDRQGDGLLHHLAENGTEAVFNTVLVHFPKDLIDRRNERGDTALMLAAARGEVGMVKALLAAGANPHVRQRFNGMALHQATHGWHVEVVNVLIDAGSDVNALDRDPEGVSPLARALYKVPSTEQEDARQLAVVERLLRAGAEVNFPQSHDVLPNLHRAIGHSLPLVAKLIEHGAMVDHGDFLQRTALMKACTMNQSSQGRARQAIDLLLRAGANINFSDNEGMTALHLAVNFNDSSLIGELVHAGADLAAEDHEGHTPLAAAQHRLETQGQNTEAAILALTLAGESLLDPILPRTRTRL